MYRVSRTLGIVNHVLVLVLVHTHHTHTLTSSLVSVSTFISNIPTSYSKLGKAPFLHIPPTPGPNPCPSMVRGIVNGTSFG